MPAPRPRPLILSCLAHDLHAHAACWGLRRNGCDPLWISSWADPALEPVSLHCDALDGVRACGTAHVPSVWYRRPRLPEAFAGANAADRPFLRNEWGRFINNLQASPDAWDDVLWVNRPEAAIAAENKLTQLRAARAVGLAFPATLMSADPVRIREFAASHRRIVYKPFQTHSWQDSDSGRIFSTYARVVEADMLDDDASLRLCPGIFQALVDKTADLRVILVGEHAYAVRLATSGDATFIDWRAGTLDQALSASPATLPGATLDRLRALMRQLGLVSGSIDLVVDADGDVHFLEINQAGQFLFLEDALPGLPLLQTMCALLASGRSDCEPSAIAGVSYAAYLASEEHARWWETVRDGIRAADGTIPGVSVE
ncbi:hypothetical protein LDO26_05255 [Luteimonas sp. BDR2-5]|uniref:hypothetical protein n=1 Tax=Proluteimonas luteida TaxID=2878685 RepID=UPI001E3F5908|nr:hypothetical protein [Luteimonas sp. BDR2-5]MCD9027614.1 hypothetical protein [Luteimonas sp. BDR2-5]